MQQQLQAITQALVQAHQPQRIILFGSQANATATAASDID